MPGKVWIIGAGPGAADLLTLRAAAALRAARVVLHDDLISTEVLDQCHPSALIINVGKRCGRHGHGQEEINSLMAGYAREGHVVARLKSGDPAIFARLGEELEALRKAGVAFEIIPGVTAVTAAAAAAGLALTDRRTASALVVLTGRNAREQSLRRLAFDLERSSYAIYMPGPDYGHTAAELMEVGIAPTTPCALVSNACRPEQKVHFTTVGRLGLAYGIAAPAILIVGGVASPQCFPEVANDCLKGQIEQAMLAAAQTAESNPNPL
jgi:uroporphyrin-III C-methyltransferase